MAGQGSPATSLESLRGLPVPVKVRNIAALSCSARVRCGCLLHCTLVRRRLPQRSPPQHDAGLLSPP